MTIDEFWKIIGRCKVASDDIDDRKAHLRDELMRLHPEEIVSFAIHFGLLLDEAYTWELWGAVYLILGGGSDDGFWDFRSALISLGREDFQRILAAPDALADLSKHEISNLHAEGFQYVDGEVYSEMTGRRLETHLPHMEDPTGIRWYGEDVEFFRKNYPKLFAEYSWHDG